VSDPSSRDELSASLRDDDLSAAETHALAQNLRRQQAQAEKIAALLPSDELNVGRSMPRKVEEIEIFNGLLAKSWSLRHENPGLMVQYAFLAVRYAKRFTARRYGLEQVFDLKGRAWAELGNAYRVLDQHDLAAEALLQARYLLEELGSGDESLLIRLCELEASLAADRRQFGYAACLLLKILDFHQRTGDRHRAGRALIKRGLYMGYGGDPEEALRLLPEGLALVDEEREPGIVHSAIHNQLLFIVDCGRFSEGRIFRLRHSRILARDEGRMNRLRLRWVEGRIEAGLGNLVSAETTFREVKQEFEESGRPYIASIVALDLAAVLLTQQLPQEAHEIVLAASKVFRAMRIEREGLAAVIVLRTTLERGKATVALAEDVAAFLRRLEHDPNARFEIRPR
jgi:tetratricopeptide (TPR) repeat protein